MFKCRGCDRVPSKQGQDPRFPDWCVACTNEYLGEEWLMNALYESDS